MPKLTSRRTAAGAGRFGDARDASAPASSGPRRTCVGCRGEAPKRELLRVALNGEAGVRRIAVIDSDGRLGGRGAYLCRSAEGDRPRAECLDAAVRRGAFARALRASVTLDPKLVESVGR